MPGTVPPGDTGAGDGVAAATSAVSLVLGRLAQRSLGRLAVKQVPGRRRGPGVTRNGAARASIRDRVGCKTAWGPTVLPVEGATRGSTFSEAVLRVLDILPQLGDLLQEVGSVGHVCRAPFRVTVLRGLWAGVWGRVGEGHVEASSLEPRVWGCRGSGGWGGLEGRCPGYFPRHTLGT